MKLRAALLDYAIALPSLFYYSSAQQFVVSSSDGLGLASLPWEWQAPTDSSNDLEITIDPGSPGQTIMGFGGAFTEASATQFKSLAKETQEQLLEMYFGTTGHRYTLGRIPINSCDFSLGSYNFDDVPDDFAMKNFDRNLAHDKGNGMIDMISRAVWKAQHAGSPLKMYGSPWSPPSWMKTNDHSMTGSDTPCLKADGRYHEAWAKYLSTWISAYQAAGVDIFGITVQNEPAFNAKWEACLYTAEEERDFIRDYIGPQLANDFGDGAKKIIMFDWNKVDLASWADTVLGDAKAAEYVWGVGLHWYTGDQFDQVWQVSQKYPDQKILPTEGCSCEYDLATYPDPWSRAARYAHDIIGDVNNGAVGWTDWNLLLDFEGQNGAGGPNHAGNLCYAQIHVNSTGDLQITPSYYAFGQFSRYVLPGSTFVNAALSADANVEFFAVQRPDGDFAVVLLNNDASEKKIALKTSTQSDSSGKMGVSLPAKSVATVVFPQPGANTIQV